MPWPSSVTAHLLLTRFSTFFESEASSEPSANLALRSMVWVVPENDRTEIPLVASWSGRVVICLGTILMLLLPKGPKKNEKVCLRETQM